MKINKKIKFVFKLNLLNTSIIVILLFITILCIIKFKGIQRHYKLFQNKIISIIHSKKLYQSIIEERKIFINEYYDKYLILNDYEKNKNIILSLINTNDIIIKVDKTKLFFTLENIKKYINISNYDSEENKVIKIHDFIKIFSYNNHAAFSSDELHNPPRYFSVYGNGLCDDVARNFDYLANQYGFNSRVWHLEGHVVADVFFNNKWHIVDPDSLGIIHYDNDIASIEEMVKLAEKGTFSENLNKIYSTTENNYIKDNNNYKKINPDDPFLIFFPNEKKYFLNKIYILPTSEKYEKLKLEDKYNKGMGNIIREIPLSSFKQNNQIIINDYFPIVGIFLKTSNTLNEKNNLKIKFDTEKTILPMYPQPTTIKINNNNYLDYTIICKTLEKYPSRRIIIKNLSLIKDKDASFLIINIYSKKNLLIANHDWKEQLNNFNITIK